MTNDALLYQNPDRATDRFLAAFLSLLKQEKYTDITITQLCQEAGLSRKTFYENFKKKEDLLDYFVNAGCIAYLKAKENQKPLLHYFKYWYDMREWILVFLENDMWNEINYKTLEHYIPLLSKENLSIMINEHQKHQVYIIHYFNAGFSEIIKQWALADFKDSPEELAEMMENLLFKNLQKGK